MANVRLRPLGAKFYGVFHNPQQVSLISLYGTWDFDNKWKNQIDAARALGANLFVYFGDVMWTTWGVTGETPVASLSVYLARRRQIVEYLARVGMYALSYAASSSYAWVQPGHTPPTNAQACAVFAADAAMMSQYPNVIGYVTEDEPWADSGGEGGSIPDATVVSDAAAQYAAVKAVVPANFAVCCAPNPCGNTALPVFRYDGAWKTRADSIAPYCDFFAFHPFQPQVPADHAAIRAAYPGKELIFPSTVATVESSQKTITTASMMALANDSTARGMAFFLATDFDANTWGLFNNDFTPRSDATVPFSAGIVQTHPKRPIRGFRGQPRLNAYRQWGYV